MAQPPPHNRTTTPAGQAEDKGIPVIASVAAIAAEIGVSERTVQRALRDLEAEGLVRRVGSSGVAYELRLPGVGS